MLNTYICMTRELRCTVHSSTAKLHYNTLSVSVALSMVSLLHENGRRYKFKALYILSNSCSIGLLNVDST